MDKIAEFKEYIYKQAGVQTQVKDFIKKMPIDAKCAIIGGTAMGMLGGLRAVIANKKISRMTDEEKIREGIPLNGKDAKHNVLASVLIASVPGALSGVRVGNAYKKMQDTQQNNNDYSKYNSNNYNRYSNYNNDNNYNSYNSYGNNTSFDFNKASTVFGQDVSGFTRKEEVKQAFKRAAKNYHPDLHPEVDPQKMKDLNIEWDKIQNSAWFSKLALLLNERMEKLAKE